ncbi:MAG: alpha-amylase [Lachnospiraceae bacterium]|nr:alpha-amylase [Lachnospiraceae bacterium]
MAHNKTMMQYFEWYLPNDGLWWKRCAAKAENLSSLGITQVWLPPAYKGTSQEDVGYGVYDMYDLGEFDQKGTVRTKYGTKDEYLAAIDSFHNAGIEVFADIVLNHRMGGDELEEVTAVTDAEDDRNQQVGGKQKVRVWSKFTFPGRNGKYSSFTWDHRHFSGTDWAEDVENGGHIYRFTGKKWEPDTDPENGNFDYLMGMNVDMSNPTVISETKKWLEWYIQTAHLDGLRLDAVKHISFSFYRELLHEIREKTGLPLPAVGEYWSGELERLMYYLESVDDEMSLFDVALHYNFFHATQAGGSYDMRTILDQTLVKEKPGNAVTFVDNHDTQYGQSLQSFIDDWFKPLAYAIILLRGDGIPCVFYSDYYGNPVQNRPLVPNLGKMIKTRYLYAYGPQEDYFDDPHVIGWTRQGDQEHPDSGLAVLMSNAEGGTKRMFVGTQFAGEAFYDMIGNCPEKVIIDEDGWGEFRTEGGNVAVWMRQSASENLIVNE